MTDLFVPSQHLTAGEGSVWYATSHRHAATVLGSRTFVRRRRVRPSGSSYLARIHGAILSSLDPPAHTRLRRALASCFSQGALSAIVPGARREVRDLVARATVPSVIDVKRELAEPVALATVGAVLGVRSDELAALRPPAEACSSLIDPAGARSTSAATREQMRAFTRSIEALLDRTASKPQCEQSPLVRVLTDPGNDVSQDEAIASFLLMFLAGYETTTALIASLVALLSGERTMPCDASAAHAFVEETLRYQPPVRMTTRVTRSTTELDGQRLEPGSQIVVVLAAANRDHVTFSDADHFQSTRTPNEHLSFGRGDHFCLGARIARTVSRTVVASLAECVQSVSVLKEVPNLNGLSTLQEHSELFVRWN